MSAFCFVLNLLIAQDPNQLHHHHINGNTFDLMDKSTVYWTDSWRTQQLKSIFFITSILRSVLRTWISNVEWVFKRFHRGPVNSPHKWPVTRKMFPFDDIIMQVSFRDKVLNNVRCKGHKGYPAWGNVLSWIPVLQNVIELSLPTPDTDT